MSTTKSRQIGGRPRRGALGPRLSCRTRAIWPLATPFVLALLGPLGCQSVDQPQPAACSNADLPVVAADAQTPGTVYLLAGTTVRRADDTRPLVSFVPDATMPALLAPQAGGFILIDGGAAARRFDSSGQLLWSIGYGLAGGDAGALLDDDRLLLADAEVVRLFDAQGALVWSRGLPRSVSEATVVAAAPDGAGGAWISWTFAGTFPPWATETTTPESPPAGPFLIEPNSTFDTSGREGNPLILHLDQNGGLIGGGAWYTPVTFDQMIGSADSTGQPMVVMRGRLDDGGRLAAALDSGGNLLWSKLIDQGGALAGDEGGGVFELADLDNQMQIDRWDPSGDPIAQTLSGFGGVDELIAFWTIAPDANGFLVMGRLVPRSYDGEGSCTPSDFLWQVGSTGLTVSLIPLVGNP